MAVELGSMCVCAYVWWRTEEGDIVPDDDDLLLIWKDLVACSGAIEDEQCSIIHVTFACSAPTISYYHCRHSIMK